jgi:hypothetical protein
MLGCLPNPHIGGDGSDVFHSYLLSSVLGVGDVATGGEARSSAGIVWFAHIGMDRALG